MVEAPAISVSISTGRALPGESCFTSGFGIGLFICHVSAPELPMTSGPLAPTEAPLAFVRSLMFLLIAA